VFLILITLIGCSEGDADAKNEGDVGLDEGGTTVVVTAEECEAKPNEADCVQSGCTYVMGYAGAGELESECIYDETGRRGFCLLVGSNEVSSLTTTYVRAIDSTHDEAIMLPKLFNAGLGGGWLACTEASAS